MKLCVADKFAGYVDAVYNNLAHHNGLSMLLATLCFTFQIYGDFCGYSLIAIGVAKCLNFDLMTNFNRPYFATNIQEFWRRWHISLSTWFMDYVYIPLGGSRCSKLRHIINLIITFVVSGIWHGANWTFLTWGLYHGVLVAVYAVWKSRHKATADNQVLGWVFTFILVFTGWAIFRANSISDIPILLSMFNPTTWAKPFITIGPLLYGFMSLIVVLMAEYKMERKDRIFDVQTFKPKYAFYLGAVVFYILTFGEFNQGQFIYFQF